MSKVPSVAIVGRPNVGKSTLFNRLLGKQQAVAHSMPGVTRDRNEAVCHWRGRSFTLVDTGGWLTGDKSELEELVLRQAEAAVRTAKVVLFVVDGSTGLLPEDRAVADVLRRRAGASAKTLVVVNKVDSFSREGLAAEAYELGLGKVIAVSALHGLGIGDLLDEIIEELGEEAPPEEETVEEVPSIAIVGRPNVGKSTLFNRLVAEERAIVSPIPGTTRDSIDSMVEFPGGKRYRFIDTAGLRKERKYDVPADFYSATRTYRAIDRSDLALIVLDSTEGVTRQDQQIAERALAGGCGVVVLLNKWDLLDGEAKASVKADAAEKLRFLSFAPVIEISALTGKGIHRLPRAIEEVLEAHNWRIQTSTLNAVLEEIVSAHPAPLDRRRGRRPKTLYATQAARRPPTFVLFTSGKLPDHYLRYLENQLRSRLGIGPTPIKMKVVQRRRARQT